MIATLTASREKAVKFQQKRSEIPGGIRTPLKDLKVKMAHCQVLPYSSVLALPA